MLVEWITEWMAPRTGEGEEWGAMWAGRTGIVPPTPTEMPVACVWHGQASQAFLCPTEKSTAGLRGGAGMANPMLETRLEGS